MPTYLSPMPAHRRLRPPVALTIAGCDPSGGAGQEADLKAFLRHGVYGLNLTTLLTVQNTHGVQAVQPLDPDFLERQWTALFADFTPAVIKLGALGALPMVRRVAALLERPEARHIPVVLDPVLGSTSGSPLLAAEALRVFRTKLLPRCRVVTPNVPEFEALFGTSRGKVRDKARGNANANAASKETIDWPARLRALGPLPYAVLLKGGHAGFTGARIPDWLWDGGRLYTLQGTRHPVGNIHGTGCSLASALAAGLARGKSLPAAARAAKAFVNHGIATAPALGHGNGPLNFMD